MKKSRINPCLVLLNVLFACVGAAFIGVGVWLALNNGSNCVHFLQTFLVSAGLFMVAVAAAGLVGSFCRIMWLLYLNFVVILLLLLVLLGTTVFVLVVTSHGIKAYVNEHSKDPLSGWLLQQVNQRIKSCTQNGQICQFVYYSSVNSYYNRPGLSSLQKGCCEPPAGCSSSTAATNATTLAMQADCEAWSEVGTEGFCSRCSSCRAAVAENIRRVWHQVAIFKVITLLILIPTYFLTCCYFKQDEDGPSSSNESSCREGLNCLYSCL